LRQKNKIVTTAPIAANTPKSSAINFFIAPPSTLDRESATKRQGARACDASPEQHEDIFFGALTRRRQMSG
jgi:hypothetical protein